MAKFYGKVGFTKTVETSKDLWDTIDTVRVYCGDVNRSQRRWESNPESVNSNFTVSNEIVLMIDDFMQQNVGNIRWVEYMGSKWQVNSVIVEYPHLVITLGGVYNGG